MQKSGNSVAKIVKKQIKKCSGVCKNADVTVISAVQLTEEQLQNVKSVLAKKLGEVVEITNLLDKSLIGGLIFKFEGRISDMSLKAQLAKLKLQIMEMAIPAAVDKGVD